MKLGLEHGPSHPTLVSGGSLKGSLSEIAEADPGRSVYPSSSEAGRK